MRFFLSLVLLIWWRSPGCSGSDITSKYQDIANGIREHLITGAGKGEAHSWLTVLSDTFGPREASSSVYKNASNDLVKQLQQIPGVSKVWTETVDAIPAWSRGHSQLQLLQPRSKFLSALALANSAATPNGGITAKAVVVTSFNELDGFDVNDRIVVYNQPWDGYAASSQYREKGAIEAAQRGAVAALVRSVTPKSLYTLHTGKKAPPKPGVPDIPVASITVEDAELLYRLQQAGHDLQMKLELNTEFIGPTSSDTVIAEIEGSTVPEELVVIGGHFDSIAIGEGAIDNGAGCAVVWQTLQTLASLNLRPKRTVRAVFWNAQEFGGLGEAAYYARHKAEAPSMSLVMRSDSGTSSPSGIHFSGNDASQDIMSEVMDLLTPINAGQLTTDNGWVDPSGFEANDDVPGAELSSQSDTYFWYHHSKADTVEAVDADDLDRSSTVFATVTYVVADLESVLPRGNAASCRHSFHLLLLTLAVQVAGFHIASSN